MKGEYVVIAVFVVLGLGGVAAGENHLRNQPTALETVVAQLQACGATQKSLSQALSETQATDFLSEMQKGKTK